MAALNPEYQIAISTDAEVDEYLKTYLSWWDYTKIKNKKIVEKIDLWRLIKLYEEGGIYIDIDRYCNIAWKDVIGEDIKCILPTHRDIDFSQDIMISCPKNPIFKKAIRYNLRKRWLINPRGVFHLGPPLYMRVAEIVLERYKRKPGLGIMQSLRSAIESSEHIATYRKTCRTILSYTDMTQKNGLKGTAVQRVFHASESIVHG